MNISFKPGNMLELACVFSNLLFEEIASFQQPIHCVSVSESMEEAIFKYNNEFNPEFF
jgi:hypothetical protein